MSLSETLKKARIKQNISQRDLAEKLGYTSPQFVSNWERGVSNPPMSTLSELVKILKLDPRKTIEIYIQETKEKILKEFNSYSRKKA